MKHFLKSKLSLIIAVCIFIIGAVILAFIFSNSIPRKHSTNKTIEAEVDSERKAVSQVIEPNVAHTFLDNGNSSYKPLGGTIEGRNEAQQAVSFEELNFSNESTFSHIKLVPLIWKNKLRGYEV